jgi:transposase
MDIKEVKSRYPMFSGMDDADAVKAFHQHFYPDFLEDEVAKRLGGDMRPKVPDASAPDEGRTVLGMAKDIGITALKGAMAVPEAAVGLLRAAGWARHWRMSACASRTLTPSWTRATGDFVSRVAEGSKQVLGGAVSGDGAKVMRGAMQMAPKAVSNLEKGVGMGASGTYKDTRGGKVSDVTPTEAIGFQPSSVADIQEANYLRQQAKNFYNMKSQEIRALWAKGIAEKDHGYIPHVVGRRTEADIKRRDRTKKARRWVVEVCRSWFNRFRKLLVRYEKLERSFVALNHLAAAIIVFRKVPADVNITYG